MFRNRNFRLQIRIPWVNLVLSSEFHESRSKTAIIREEMAIFLLTLYIHSKIFLIKIYQAQKVSFLYITFD